jgi:glycosyltransferase involved in cell wall biosynthesis
VRVLQVADFYPPAPGGLEAHVRRLAHALTARGHAVEVVAGAHAPHAPPVRHEDDGGVPVHRVAGRLGRLPGLHRQAGHAFHPPWPDDPVRYAIARVLARFDPDVIHAHGWSAFSAAAAAGDRPVVVTLHDYGLRCPKKTLLRGDHECATGRGLRCATCPGAEQATAKRIGLAAALVPAAPWLRHRVTRVIAVSSHVAERHRDEWPAIDVIPNFLDPPPVRFRAYAPPAGTGILFVGPADRHKGLPVLLRAMRHLPPSTRLTVAGALGDGDERVEFAGRLTGERLWRRYLEAALVVAPATWPDPCPTVVLEAMAMGRPVVGSAIGGLPDLVVPGVTGLLVPPDDDWELATALERLLVDERRLQAMAAAAHARAAAFSTEAVVPRIEAVYAGQPVEFTR